MRDRLALELEQACADLAAQRERASDNEDALDKRDRLERDYRVTVEGDGIGVLRADGAFAAIVDNGSPLAALFAAAHEHDELSGQNANQSEGDVNV